MLVEFLNPEKLPKYSRPKKVDSSPIIALNFRTKKISLSVGLNNALSVLDSDYTHLQFAKGTDVLEDKTEVKRAFIVPTKGTGWLVTKKEKAKTYFFSSTPLILHLKDLWDISDNHKTIKIPVFIEPTDVQGVKCLEINLSYVKKEYGNSDQTPNK